jgi:hypothetical protein
MQVMSASFTSIRYSDFKTQNCFSKYPKERRNLGFSKISICGGNEALYLAFGFAIKVLNGGAFCQLVESHR